MSPPIRDGSGSSIGSIRLGDGSEIAEVRTGAGDVLFTPDSGLLHRYDWSDDMTTTTTVPDLVGDDNMTGTFSSLNGQINGTQAGIFDGVSDSVNAAYNDGSQPTTRFIVARLKSSGGSQQMLCDGFDSKLHIFEAGSGNVFAMFAGNKLTASFVDQNNHIIEAKFDGGASEMRIDGVSEVTGNAGTSNPGGITVGEKNNGGSNANMAIGEVLEYEHTNTGYSRSDVENYLSNKWGIAL